MVMARQLTPLKGVLSSGLGKLRHYPLVENRLRITAARARCQHLSRPPVSFIFSSKGLDGVKIHTTDGAFEAIETASYCLRAIDARSLRLSVRGRALADLRVVSGVSTGDGGPDVSTNLQGPEVREEDGCVLLTWRSSSTCWNRKTYTFECGAEQFVYRVGVEGERTGRGHAKDGPALLQRRQPPVLILS